MSGLSALLSKSHPRAAGEAAICSKHGKEHKVVAIEKVELNLLVGLHTDEDA